MKAFTYLLGTITIMLSLLGILYKILHRPGAAPMFVVGIAGLVLHQLKQNIVSIKISSYNN